MSAVNISDQDKVQQNARPDLEQMVLHSDCNHENCFKKLCHFETKTADDIKWESYPAFKELNYGFLTKLSPPTSQLKYCKECKRFLKNGLFIFYIV